MWLQISPGGLAPCWVTRLCSDPGGGFLRAPLLWIPGCVLPPNEGEGIPGPRPPSLPSCSPVPSLPQKTKLLVGRLPGTGCVQGFKTKLPRLLDFLFPGGAPFQCPLLRLTPHRLPLPPRGCPLLFARPLLCQVHVWPAATVKQFPSLPLQKRIPLPLRSACLSPPLSRVWGGDCTPLPW